MGLLDRWIATDQCGVQFFKEHAHRGDLSADSIPSIAVVGRVCFRFHAVAKSRLIQHSRLPCMEGGGFAGILIEKMSGTNIELHRCVVDAFNARDLAAYTALADPGVEYHSAIRTALAGPAVYRGHAGLRSWFDDIDDVWGDQIRIEPNAYFDLGEHTLALFVLRGRGKSSGAEVTMDLIQVIKWRDDLIVYVKVYNDRAEALRDMGISEDALEPIAP